MFEELKVIQVIDDEVVIGTAKNERTSEELEAIMNELPSWAKGYPITSEGWVNTRYRK